MGAPMAPRAPMALIGGGGAKKVLTVQLGNETTDNSKRQGNKEDRQEIGYARFQESLQKLATCQEWWQHCSQVDNSNGQLPHFWDARVLNIDWYQHPGISIQSFFYCVKDSYCFLLKEQGCYQLARVLLLWGHWPDFWGQQLTQKFKFWHQWLSLLSSSTLVFE